MTTQSPPRKNDKNEPSLLEDASTLLMFSKGANEGSRKPSIPSEGSQQDQERAQALRRQSIQMHTEHQVLPCPPPPQQLSRTSTRGGVSPINSQVSPGPASVALLHDDSSSLKDQSCPEPISHLTNQQNVGSMAVEEQDDNGKGMVAAAALAAAATVPLPLKSSHSRSNSNSNSIPNTNNEQWPVPDSYVVNIDSGIITCICGFDDDDGFTIQCDHCNRWQHAICYNIKDIETAPDDYLCNVCDPRKLDARKARKKQLERLQYNKLSNDSSIHNDDFARDAGSGAGPGEPGNDNWYGKPRKLNSDENAEDINNEEQRRKRKRHEDVAMEDTKRKKETPIYLSAKEAYSELYLPTDHYEFNDKYVKLFIDKHGDDDSVIPYNEENFIPIPLAIKSYADAPNSKVFPGFSKLGVHACEKCYEGQLICEYLGKVDFQKNYIMDPRNHYRIWGTSKLRVLFHPRWPLYIDARLTGNVARYVRRSCHPNAELATIKMTNSNEIRFVLRAIKELEEGEEICLDWHWDLRHPIWRIIKGSATLDSLSDADKYLLIHSVVTILSACDCGCGNNKDCLLLKVKKFSQTLCKSVKSKMNNRYKLNEILNRYEGKKRRPPPILDRLSMEATRNQERASKVLAEFDAKRLEAAGLNSNTDTVTKDCVIKPYKWKLLESHNVADESPHSTASTTVVNNTRNRILNPHEYDESEISDLEMLPIPIILKVPDSYGDSHLKNGIKREKSLGLPSISDTKSREPVSDQSSLNGEIKGTSSLHIQEIPDKKPTKKKLSFADYRKKQYK